MAMVRAVLYEYSCTLLVNTGNRLVNFWQKFGKQWELESVLKSKRTVPVFSIVVQNSCMRALSIGYPRTYVSGTPVDFIYLWIVLMSG